MRPARSRSWSSETAIVTYSDINNENLYLMAKKSIIVDAGHEERYCLDNFYDILSLTGRHNWWNKNRVNHPGHDDIILDSNKT